jgi:predicted nucleic acid-binding protein
MKYYAVIDTNVLVSAITEVLPDPKDAIFYQVVLEKHKTGDAYLVTGNIRHFPIKPFIVTPKEMCTLIEQEE